jgi:hypothetical protein
MNALLDNDVLLKGACYGLLDQLITSPYRPAGVLGAALFVVSRRIAKTAFRKNSEIARAGFEAFLLESIVLEPTDDEQTMAADFELAAQRAGVPLDAGESQLCAILVRRVVPVLITGDKRAIRAIELLLDSEPRLCELCGRIRCLEQLVRGALTRDTSSHLRDAICAEPAVDKALAICFSCTNETGTYDSFVEGLDSYIAALTGEAKRVLSA